MLLLRSVEERRVRRSAAEAVVAAAMVVVVTKIVTDTNHQRVKIISELTNFDELDQITYGNEITCM